MVPSLEEHISIVQEIGRIGAWTHSSEKTPRVPFAPEETDTWLLCMDWVQTPYPDGSIVGRRGDDPGVSGRGYKIVQFLFSCEFMSSANS